MSKTAQLIAEIVQTELSDEMSSLYINFPATLVEYSNQIAKVQPTVNVRFSDGDTGKLPAIGDVPVIFPAGGGGILSFPLKVGDPVWVQCSSLALDQWLSEYKLDLIPDTRRMHSFNDAVCTPQVFPENIRMGVSDDNIELTFNKVNTNTKVLEERLSGLVMLPDGSVELDTKHGSKLHLLADGNIEITTAQTIKIQNSSEELVSLCSDLMQTLVDTTVNTAIGPMPLNTKAAIAALKTRLDTLKA